MALPDSLNLGHDAEFEDYMSNIHSYLGKVNGGRAIRVVDPRQDAFSHQAEVRRQVHAVDRANLMAQNTPPDEQDLPESLDLGEGGADGLPDNLDLSEGNPGPKAKGPLEVWQSYRPDWSTVDTGASDGVISPTLQGTRDIMNVLGEVTAPLATIRDYTFGLFTGKPGQAVTPKEVGDIFSDPNADHTDWRTNIIPGTVEGLAEMSLPMMKGKTPTARPGMVEPPPVPKVMSPTDLDNLVAERSMATGVYPEVTDFPARKVETGNTLVAPTLEPGVHTQPGKYKHNDKAGGLQRDALGRKIKTPSVTQPGHYSVDESGQMDMLGGYNVVGEDPYLTGKYVLRPGEELNTEMGVMRPQKAYIEGMPAEQTNLLNTRILGDTVGKEGTEQLGLKARMLTPEEERTLNTPYMLESRLPVDVKINPGGRSASAGGVETPGLTIPKDLTVGNTVNGAVFPSLMSRTFGAVTDAMKKAGPVGEGISSLFNMAYNNRAIGTSNDMMNVTKAFDELWGARGFIERKVQGTKQLLAGENPFIYGMTRHWKITPQEEESLFNYLYTGGKAQPLNDKVKQAGDILFQNGTYPASADPGVQSLMITNPFTGKKIPVGQPSMFMPQQPIHPITVDAINEKSWGLLYERAGGESLGMSQETFKKTIIAISEHDPEVTAFKMKGLENMRLLDLNALGGSPYQWAKKLGYETDPFRAVFRFNSLARLRGQLAQIEPHVNGLLDSIPADQQAANKWLRAASDRAMLNPGKFDTLQTTQEILRTVGRLEDVSMLQLGGVANLAQVMYAFARGGPIASAKGFKNLLTGVDRDVINRSGALFPAALNELTVPTGAMARWSSAAFRSYGLSSVDRFTRYFAGHVGNQFIKGIEQSLLKDPTNKRLAGLIGELGGDAKAVLEAGSIPEDMRYSMIQTFANRTAGVTDVRGVPLWATSENPWARLVNKYRTFAMANSAEIRRLVQDSPDRLTAMKRLGLLGVGGLTVGAGINDARQGLTNLILGTEAKPDKSFLQHQLEAAALGLGTVEGMLLIQASKNPTNAVVGLVGGPTAGVGASFLQDLQSTVTHGVGWRTFDTASKRLPVVGPITGPMVQKQVRRESKREAEIQREMNAE